MAEPSESELTKLLIPAGAAKTFEQHLTKTQVSDAVLEFLDSATDAEPFIMLNLVRFRPRRDPTIYMRYGRIAGPAMVDQGSFVAYVAPVIHDLPASYNFDNSWDEIVGPVYSRLASYGLAQSNPEYQAAIPDRVAGTYQRHLYVLKDGNPVCPAALTIKQLHQQRVGIPHEETDVLIGEFLRFKKPDGRATYEEFGNALAPLVKKAGGEILLSVEAAIPVVSEELWDHFTLTRYPSLDAFQTMFKSNDHIEAERLRRAALEARIAVASSPAAKHEMKNQR